jgi:hypothetical protein
MEPTQCSETSAFNTQTPGKYPEGNLSLQQHGESLKTRISTKLLGVDTDGRTDGHTCFPHKVFFSSLFHEERLTRNFFCYIVLGKEPRRIAGIQFVDVNKHVIMFSAYEVYMSC